MKPLKAPNEIYAPSSSHFRYDKGVYASIKRNGNRILILGGEALTSAMKEPRNRPLIKEVLAPILRFAEREALMFDMEVWSAEHHGALAGWINSYDQPPLPDVKVEIFDCAPLSAFDNECRKLPYTERRPLYPIYVQQQFKLHPHIEAAKQTLCESPEHAQALFDEAIANGEEGIMLRHGDIWSEGRYLRGGWYKHGRATVAEKIMFKMKHFVTLDGIIREVVQRKTIRPDWPREHNPDGTLRHPLEKAAFMLYPSVGTFVIEVILDDNRTVLTEVMFGRGFPMYERERMWREYREDPSSLIGKHVEISHMPHGALKDGKLQIGRFIRFRPDKDE